MEKFVLQGSRIVVTMLVTLLLGACSHQVLTFFFTGVPDPNQPVAAIPSTNATETDAVGDIAERPVEIPPQNAFTHGPWANRQCDLCHVSSGGVKFNNAAAGAVSVRLAFDAQEICRGCHNDVRFTNEDPGLWRHGPATNGYCTTCHSPHRSQRPFMLYEADNNTLCGRCHQLPTLHKNAPIEIDNGADCASCHDPHASELPMLLKASVAP